MRSGIKTEWVIWAISGAVFAWLFSAHPMSPTCGWVRAHDAWNGEALWLNLAASGSQQINARVRGVAQNAVVWTNQHAIVVKESPDELVAECR